METKTSLSILRDALQAKGLRFVGTKGNLNSKVCIVGEAPGADEDRQGQPFVGYSGKLLEQMLGESGFKHDEYWVTNVVKTRPPNNEIKRLPEFGIPIALFHNQFLDEIRTYKPVIIIACGRTPTNLLCPFTQPKAFRGKVEANKSGFASWIGSLLTSPHIDWPHYVIPVWHPAFVLRDYSEKETCGLVLQRAGEEYSYWMSNRKLQPLPIRNLLVNPDFGKTYDFLRRCLASPNPISIDIELLKRKVPYTISFALSPSEAVSFSFWNYTSLELVCLWKQMNEIFKTKRQIYQNAVFDTRWLRCMGFTINSDLVEDTLILHHILHPGLPHKLEFLGMQYTRQPHWKDEGKGWTLREGLDRLMHYNALDSAVTYEVFLAEMEELDGR